MDANATGGELGLSVQPLFTPWSTFTIMWCCALLRRLTQGRHDHACIRGLRRVKASYRPAIINNNTNLNMTMNTRGLRCVKASYGPAVKRKNTLCTTRT